MNYKILISIMIVFLVVFISIGGYVIVSKNNTPNTGESSREKASNEPKVEENMAQNKKTAIVYFSATGTTRTVAEYIHDETDGDLIEIIPEVQYTDQDLNYNNNDSRANKEQNDSQARPAIANKIDISAYDTIYLGFPIWWGNVPKIILTFLDTHHLNGKTVIPFCTSHSSDISGSLNTLNNYNKDINWQEGKRFRSSAKSEIRNWIKKSN